MRSHDAEASPARPAGQVLDRPDMPVVDLVGLLLCGRPDCDMRVGAGSNDASVFEIGDGIHRAVVETQHLLGGIAAERPPDC